MTQFDHEGFTAPLKVAGMPNAVAHSLADQLERVLSQSRSHIIAQDEERLDKIEQHLVLLGNQFMELQQSAIGTVKDSATVMAALTPAMKQVASVIRWVVIVQVLFMLAAIWALLK